MQSYFAPADRLGPDDVSRQVEFASNHTIMSTFVCATLGLLAVLNSTRQIISVNDTLLKHLGLDNAGKLFGLRPGEAFHCAHSLDMPGGCGTGPYCRSCGAAIAIVTSTESGKPVEQKCLLTVGKDNAIQEFAFSVRACPITFDGERFTLLFLREITDELRSAALERAFFHDLGNVINGLSMASELLMESEGPVDERLARDVHLLVMQLKAEVEVHRTIAYMGKESYHPRMEYITVDSMVENLRALVSHHRSSMGKCLSMHCDNPGLTFRADMHVLDRILLNMLINAFEASGPGDEVSVTVSKSDMHVVIGVWNRRGMEADVAMRVFQYQFSTKSGKARGLGTYSMKLLGERVLKGKVWFESNPQEGTTFYLMLPIDGVGEE